MKTQHAIHNALYAFILSVLTAVPAAQGATIRFDRSYLTLLAASSNLDQASPQSYLVALPDDVRVEELKFVLYGDRVIGLASRDDASDLPTAAEQSAYKPIRPYYHSGTEPLTILGEVTLNNQRYAEVVAASRWRDSDGYVHDIDSVSLSFGIEQIPDNALVPRNIVTDVLNSNARTGEIRTASGESFEYVIVTSRNLVSAFEPLRQYRTALGIPTAIKAVEDILGLYAGRDDAERLRNYLKSFYSDGGRYVLLGGDASIVPVRYAFPYMTDTAVDLHNQLLCDLYFADLTGEWDVDSDNVWGERYQDQPDATPELLVGRLPIDNAEAVATYINKLIRYETNPGDGDPSYLTRTLFFSADQMRDYGTGGQHHAIAIAYPSEFEIDTATAVETPSGNAANPTNVGPLDLPTAVRQGYGIVNVIAHGRFDGFVFRSSGYNEFPKQYMLTNGYSDVQCPFDSLGSASSPSFYYSLACDNGGFDLDRPPFSSVGTNMARELISSPNGAVGMVGNTRWGWIGSSYLLHKAFFDSLFVDPNDPAIYAMYRAQQTYWYYRDLVYGQIYFGDPLVKVYTIQPRRLSVTATATAGQCTASVASHSGPESGIIVTLSDSMGIIESAVTATDGSVEFNSELALGQSYAIACAGDNTTIGFVSFTSQIVSDVNNEDVQLPTKFELYQNYPNPFNPSTQISFDLAKPDHVSLVVFNLTGRMVATLLDQTLSAGNHTVVWDGHDHDGIEAASGVYFYRLMSGEFSATRKLALVR